MCVRVRVFLCACVLVCMRMCAFMLSVFVSACLCFSILIFFFNKTGIYNDAHLQRSGLWAEVRFNRLLHINTFKDIPHDFSSSFFLLFVRLLLSFFLALGINIVLVLLVFVGFITF